MTSNIVLETHGAARWVRIARAEKKNALTRAMYDALTAALDEAEGDASIRTIVITGAPGVFSAGNDLQDFLQNPPTAADGAVFRFLTRLQRVALPLIAAVDGPAIGIGTTMLLHCDLVVATKSTRLQLPFANLGLVPEAGSTVLLPWLVGMQRASEWLLLGEPIDVEEAHRVGLVNAIVAVDALEATAQGYADAIAQRPPRAIHATKALLRGPRAEAVAAATKREAAVFAERLQSPEVVETLTAFVTKRR